jgi:hypothetical protein
MILYFNNNNPALHYFVLGDSVPIQVLFNSIISLSLTISCFGFEKDCFIFDRRLLAHYVKDKDKVLPH